MKITDIKIIRRIHYSLSTPTKLRKCSQDYVVRSIRKYVDFDLIFQRIPMNKVSLGWKWLSGRIFVHVDMGLKIFIKI